MKTDLKWIIMVIFVMKIDMLMMKNIYHIMKEIAPFRDMHHICYANDVK